MKLILYKINRVGIVPSRRSSRVLGRTGRDSIEWRRPQNIVHRPSDEFKTNRDDFLDPSDDMGRYNIAPKFLEDDIGRRTDEFRRNIIEQACHGIMSWDLKGVKYVFMLKIHFCSCLFYLPRCSSDIERDSLLPRLLYRYIHLIFYENYGVLYILFEITWRWQSSLALPMTTPMAIPMTVPMAAPMAVPIDVPMAVPMAVPKTVSMTVPMAAPMVVTNDRCQWPTHYSPLYDSLPLHQ